ncbi:MAG: phage tail family protein [Candidatus Improbicoccus pseudotrichonymphae]|uniref:Phage tail family protein n=1 Tax=Candidatus Improbicoccus pseudotrichonymphae TaxID=3033792 RepID=A0AA48L0Z6_9FIRM|nr:MAG: phage tail family protein [Candidatus Improbicoccus pseudotrichonymphae]
MNYIIWNDTDSRTIPGLLISEFPAITKPKIRTQITEIEGKDGDIIDKIGYQSYEKIIKIGLLGNFDINKIIKYFTGNGHLILSSEPDKYYICEILESIDYERLIKFRTANVKFHTQPFKYLKDEESIDVTITNQTSITVTNQGLEPSKPVITLYGNDEVSLDINSLTVFQVVIDDEYITVDSNLEDAYKGSITNLKNRQMTGIFPVLNPGENTITWTGILTRIVIEPKSRWI